jgi:hypothetical protein
MATTRIDRDYYKILLIGPSGSGKTFSMRNMDVNTTGYMNPEIKPFPFEARFKYHARPKKYAGCIKAFDDYVANDEIKIIVWDSISATFDMLLEECRQNFSGWDVWTAYNKSIGELLSKIKRAEKEIVIMGHYEILNIEGSPEKRLKVKGREMEGMIEKDFTIVLYPEIKYKGGKPERYIMKLAAEGCSAKCPPGIFGDGVYEVDSDFKLICDKVIEFAMRSAVTVTETTPRVTESNVFN